MARLRYMVLADAHGGYTVEVRSASAVLEVVSGFPNQEIANTWVRAQRRADFGLADRSPKLAPE
jgi:hypothetical protein